MAVGVGGAQGFGPMVGLFWVYDSSRHTSILCGVPLQSSFPPQGHPVVEESAWDWSVDRREKSVVFYGALGDRESAITVKLTCPGVRPFRVLPDVIQEVKKKLGDCCAKESILGQKRSSVRLNTSRTCLFRGDAHNVSIGVTAPNRKLAEKVQCIVAKVLRPNKQSKRAIFVE